MILLHGVWLPGKRRLPGVSRAEEAAFLIWGERSGDLPATWKGKRAKLPTYPCQLPPDELGTALAGMGIEIGGRRGLQPEAVTECEILLPTVAGMPVRPSEIAGHKLSEASAEAPRLAPWRVTGIVLEPVLALRFLAHLPAGEMVFDGTAYRAEGAARAVAGATLRYWSMAARLALEFLARQRFVPGLEGDKEQGYHATWRAFWEDADQVRVKRLAAMMPPLCRAVHRPVLRSQRAAEPPPATHLLEDFLQMVMEAAIRDWLKPMRRKPVTSNMALAWRSGLLNADSHISYFPELAAAAKTLAEQQKELRISGGQTFRLCFRLEAPAQIPAAEVSQEQSAPDRVADDWALQYLLQANDDLSLLVPAGMVWRERGSALRYLNRRFDQPQEKLLEGLGKAAALFPPIENSLRAARPEGVQLTPQEAYSFLRETTALLSESGFGVLVPPWWGRRARLSARLRLSPSRKQEAQTRSGLLGLNSLVSYNWELALGGETLSRAEFERLAAMKTPLVQIRGQWVELRPDQVEAALKFFKERDRKREMTLGEALHMDLAGGTTAEGLAVEAVETEGWVQDLLQRLKRGEQMEDAPLPPGLAGELRPYQQRGFSWLAFLARFGLGACLADDMGLGKTIQTIAFLLHRREVAGESPPALVICPTSVVGNWLREVNRFAPGLRVLVHHGLERAKEEAFVAQALQHDLVISSYPLARRDESSLAGVEWHCVILDEAQNIKNPNAQQTQAIRRLPALQRIALTGTPVENRLTELWSIMQFLNPGYLGSYKQFRSEFALPVERYQDADAAQRLRSLVQPFLLRRMKTDRSIIQDLPEKQEMTLFCNLTQEQATLYEAVVRDSLQQIEAAEGMARRGIVLATLMKLKQICNHPAQFLGDGSALAGRSGKLLRLAEMLEEVLALEERALIFTQFAEMGEMLKQHLQSTFGTEVLFLHGGTPMARRNQMVDDFQDPHGPPIFILSLKAGGTGLNLTHANHVFHFDRWWNPAVENQATDRAFRIGQQRMVQVHKFVCAGTLEEQIHQMIESKKKLAESIVGAGEGWLTELSTDQLREMLTLKQDAVGDE